MLEKFQKVHSIINVLNFRVPHNHTDLGHGRGSPLPLAPDHTVFSAFWPCSPHLPS